MEIAGLGIGIAGLAAMFTTCLDVMERIDSYKDFGVDSRAIMSQFDAQKLLFKRWGTAVGFDDRRLKDDHHDKLDDAATRSAVQSILSSIYEIAGGPNKLPPPDKQYRPGSTIPKSDSFDAQQSWLEKFRGDASHKTKIGWTLRHKARFFALSQHFGNLVGTLYSLVPPDAPTSMDSMHRQTPPGNAVSLSGVSTFPPKDIATSSWYIETQRILMDIEKQIERDMKKDLDAWLCASYTSNNYDTFVQKRLPGTSDWIMNREVFREWDSSYCEPSCAKVLWVNGPAGYGAVGFGCLFSADLEDRADPFIIGRHWVSQLISRNPEAFNLAYEKFDLHKTSIASSSEVMDLLKEMVHAIPQCTLVVDGLDEYFSKGHWSVTQSDGLESFMGKIIEAIRGTASRIFLASREEQEICNGLSNIDESSVGVKLLEYIITPTDVRPDATKLSESIVSQKLEKKSKAFRDEIARRMVDRCDSMLLQIQLLGSEIRATKNQKQTERIIDQTPVGLSNLYDRAWLRIIERGNETPRALAILRWVAFGLRPLTILEMTEALILTDLEFVDNFEDEMPDELNEDYVRREILDFCAALVETRASSSSNDWGSRTVHFTHFTVRGYVLQHLQRDPTNRSPENNELALTYDSVQNNKLAEICLRYLIMSGSRTKTQHENTSHSDHSFGVYARNFMHKHVRRDAANYTAVDGLLIEFFCNEDTQWDDWRRHHDSKLDSFPMLSYKGKASSACPLFYASLLGFQEVVEELIHVRGVDVDHVDESGRTGLLAATHENKYELIERFLQRNADINKASQNGFTPLYIAAAHGNYETAQRFLGSGADLTITTSGGWTALVAACLGGHYEVAELLLEKGADLNIATQTGWTALAAACGNGHLEIVRLLLERGADLRIANDHGETPLALACSEGHLEVVKLLLERGGDLTVPNQSGWTALAAASASGHLKIVRLLLERGADLTIANSNGCTPLYLASSNGSLEVVKLLLEKDADLTVASNTGWTPLAAACENGYHDTTRLLLEWGADLTTSTDNGFTPLNQASSRGHLEVVKLLLEKGADSTVANKDGCAPILLASNNGHFEVVKILLDNGANLSTADDHGWTPINAASVEGHLDTVELLVERGADLNAAGHDGWNPLNCASDEGHVDVVELLLEKGADMNITNNDGSTPFQLAAGNGHFDVVKLFLDKGVDVNEPDEYGWTPLYSASRQGHIEVISELLKGGADTSIATRSGETPMAAVAGCGHLEAAELLLREGAAVTALTPGADTPLHVAAMGGHSDVVRLLLRNGANIRTLDVLGRPPFFYTIKAGDLTSFSVLQCQEFLHHEFKDVWGSNALSFAVRYGHEDMIRALSAISKQSLTEEDRFGRTPVWWAHKQGNVQMVERVAALLGPLSRSNPPTGPSSRFAAKGDWCDVCFASIDGQYYACRICYGEEFAMCLECHSVGAHCLVDSHALIYKG